MFDALEIVRPVYGNMRQLCKFEAFLKARRRRGVTLESGPEGTLKEGDGPARPGGALNVAVIGAGIVGSSVAYRLSEGGAEVIMIDRAEPGSGTTSTSFAWVNANNKLPRDYFELNLAGMREHELLSDEISGSWLHSTGNLIQATDEEQENLEKRVERLSSWSYAAEMLTASTVNGKLEPKLFSRTQRPGSRTSRKNSGSTPQP